MHPRAGWTLNLHQLRASPFPTDLQHALSRVQKSKATVGLEGFSIHKLLLQEQEKTEEDSCLVQTQMILFNGLTFKSQNWFSAKKISSLRGKNSVLNE